MCIRDSTIRVSQQHVALAQLHTASNIGSIGNHTQQETAFGKSLQRSIFSQQKSRRMTGATVFKLTGKRVETRNQKTSEWNHRSHQTDIAIHPGNNELRFRRYGGTRTYQTDEVRGPHPCRQSLTTHISQRENDAVARLFDGEEVTGQVANCKDLTGDIEISIAHQAGRTESPVDLGRFKDGRVQLSVIFLQSG